MKEKNLNKLTIPAVIGSTAAFCKLSSVPLFDVSFVASCIQDTCDFRLVGYSYAYKIVTPLVAGAIYACVFPEHWQAFKDYVTDKLRRIKEGMCTVTFTIPRCEIAEDMIYTSEYYPSQYKYRHRRIERV